MEERRRKEMSAFVDIVGAVARSWGDGVDPSVFHGFPEGARPGAIPAAAPAGPAGLCDIVGPGHCINRFLEYKLIPKLSRSPAVETASVEAGNRLVLTVEGVPYVVHNHDPAGVVRGIHSGRVARWAPPLHTLLVEAYDGRSSLFKLTSEPLEPCSVARPEALRYAAWLNAVEDAE